MSQSGSILRVAILAVVAAGSAEGANAAGWEPALHSGEAERAAIGCASRTTDDSWACLVVRCDDDGRLALYADIAGGGTANGGWMLGIDGAEWRVEGEPLDPPGAYSSRIRGDTAGIVSALKQGKRMTFGPQLQLNRGFETVLLSGSEKAIARVEHYCAR